MTTVYLYAGTTQWPVPSDCQRLDSVQCYGAGGGGGIGDDNDGQFWQSGAGGGGGGGYSFGAANLAVTPSSVINVGVGYGGIAPSSAAETNGTPGGNTWFNGTSLASCTVGAQGGRAGLGAHPGTAGTGGLGGQASAGVGTTKYSGGNGADGFRINANSGIGAGGGGAAGPSGNGQAGKGTQFDQGGGASGGGNGGAGGRGDDATGNVQAGFAYGGGSGGYLAPGGTLRAGGDGLIVITYTPQVTVNLAASSLATGSPGSGVPALGVRYTLSAQALAPSSPVLGAPAGGYVLAASGLTSSSPELGAPVLYGGMAALSLSTSSPVLGAPAMTHFFLLSAVSLTTSSPVIGLGYTVGVLSAVALAPSSPVLGTPTITQRQVMAARDLVPASPEFGKPNRLPSPPPHYPADMDIHVRRNGGDYTDAFLELLPKGQAWPRRMGSTLYRAVDGLCGYWGFVDGRAADLLERESDPRQTVEILPDWERNWGLPDPCFKETTTIEERQNVLVMVMTLMGGQSRDFYYGVANMMGYSIHIQEFSPFMCGISQVGDTRKLPLDPNPLVGEYRWYIGPPEMRFYWIAHHTNASLNWFRASSGQAGVDPHLRIGLSIDMDCLLNRWKPAHTELVFAFDNLQTGGPMAGTP